MEAQGRRSGAHTGSEVCVQKFKRAERGVRQVALSKLLCLLFVWIGAASCAVLRSALVACQANVRNDTHGMCTARSSRAHHASAYQQLLQFAAANSSGCWLDNHLRWFVLRKGYWTACCCLPQIAHEAVLRPAL